MRLQFLRSLTRQPETTFPEDGKKKRDEDEKIIKVFPRGEEKKMRNFSRDDRFVGKGDEVIPPNYERKILSRYDSLGTTPLTKI